MRFFIYSRKSVYSEKGESIENQIEMCREYIRGKFPGEGDEGITVYEDEGFSAKNTQRPQFQRMLGDIRREAPDFVVCYRLDRISRNVSDFSALIEELNVRGISFVCIKEEFDTSKPMGKAMMYIASVFAQLERETIAERVRDNMLMLARTGRWLGGTAPTGYTSEKHREIIIDGKVKSSCRLKERPEEIPAVDAMFEKFLELRSISGVSKYLIRQGIKSRTGNYYSLPGIKQILQNPVYCIADKDAFDYFTKQNADVCFEEKDCSDKYGLLAYNKRDYKKKHAARQPVERWIIAVGRHTGRIPGETWAQVQRIIEENIPTGAGPAKMHNDYALLSGMIYCEKCGSRMFAKPRSGRGAKPGAYDYICGGKLRGGKLLCDCRNIGGGQADDMLWEKLAGQLQEGPQIFGRLEKLKRDLQVQARKDALSGTQARIRRCSGELERLMGLLSRGELEPAFVRRIGGRISELDRELSELERTQALKREAVKAADTQGRLDMLAQELCGMKGLSVYEKRALIKLLTQKITWDGERLRVFISGGG